MAEHELSGTELTPEMLSFVNQAVVLSEGCGDPSLVGGWYFQLFFNAETAPDFDPSVTDVHTQPTDEVGNMARAAPCSRTRTGTKTSRTVSAR
jgi:hypothetical protein